MSDSDTGAVSAGAALLEARIEARLREEALAAPPLAPEEAHRPVSNRASVVRSAVFEGAFGELGESDAEGALVVREEVTKPRERSRASLAPRGGARELDALLLSLGPDIEHLVTQAAEVRPRRVFGEDERVEIGDTRAYPWRCICSLRAMTADGLVGIGTGWLVSPRLVLTAGHCLYFHDHGGWAREIEVIPARRGEERPFGSAVSRAFRSTRAWVDHRVREDDYGAIILPSDARYGDRLGWLGYAVRDDDTLEGATANLAGYPSDKGGSTQWFNAQEITSVTDGTLRYFIDTFRGQSGSPVWQLMQNGGRYGVGIHNYGFSSANQATRITDEVFQNIVGWVGQAA